MSDPLVSYVIVWFVGGVAFAIWMVAVVRQSVRREEKLRRGEK